MKYLKIVLIALLIVISIILKYVRRKNKTYDKNKSSEEIKKQKVYNIITASASVIIVVMVVGGLYAETKTHVKVDIDKNIINVSAGLLDGGRFNTEDIKDVLIKDTIPASSKVMGTSLGDFKRGTFNVDGLGKGHLYIETGKGPYLYIMLKDSFIIINYKDSEKTQELYKIALQYKR